MLSSCELERLRSLNTSDITEIVDVKNMHVDMSLSFEQRMESYQQQIKNPYCFRSGGTVIRIKFSEHGKSIDESVESYLKAVKICNNS